jgi:hypothetical protein
MDSVTLGNSTLIHGGASLVVSGLSSTHTFTATYNGDNFFNTSTSANLINAAPAGGGIAYTPAQIRSAYGINNLSLDGSGQTIAIVEAYADPAIYQALDAFDGQFGLTSSGPRLYDQYGPASSFLSVVNRLCIAMARRTAFERAATQSVPSLLTGLVIWSHAGTAGGVTGAVGATGPSRTRI